MSNPFEQRDFQPSDLDSLINIFLLTPEDPLDTFAGQIYFFQNEHTVHDGQLNEFTIHTVH